MGIKGLKAFLRSKFPETIVRSHLSHFFGKRVAVDVLPYLFKFKAVQGDQWRHGMLQFMMNLLAHTVHPCFITDGPCVTTEKREEQEKRKSAKSKLGDKIKSLQEDLTAYEQTAEISDRMKSLPIQVNSFRGLLLGDAGGDLNTEAVQNHIDKLIRQKVTIAPEDLEDVREMCGVLRFPFYTAKQEAESLCSFLCLRGEVDAVVTEDSDVLAYGAPCWISGIEHDGSCLVVESGTLRRSTELSASEWLDFCIMCGTDYNHGVEKFGPVSSFRAIREHRTIEAVCAAHGLGAEWKPEIVRPLFLQPCSTAVRSKRDRTEVACRPGYNPRPDRQKVLDWIREKGYSSTAVYSFFQNEETKFIIE
jgi:5'-3' exonuclease